MIEVYQDVPEWLKNMPKTELHCHMGGSIRLDTVLDLAEKYNITLPTKNIADLEKLVVYKSTDNGRKSLLEYISGIKVCESVMVMPEAFERVAYEIAQDAHKENVKVLELRFAPTNYERQDMPLFQIVEGMLKGLSRASKDFDMYAGLIICGIRTDMNAMRKAAEIAVNYQDKGVVGFDIAGGKEREYSPKLFVDALKPVRANFLPITIHAGEEANVGSIAEAIKYLGAQRIGHAISLRESRKLFEFVDKMRICLEMCPTSNINTGAVHSYSTHPIRTYMQDNLRVAVNTDNRTISNTTLTNEYMQLIAHVGLTQRDILKTVNNGIKASFLDSKTTRKLLNELSGYVKSLGYESLETLCTDLC
jgi:adenosine deaminase